MLDRILPLALSALLFAAPYAQADENDETPSERRTVTETTDVTDDLSEAIDEIVVIGKRRSTKPSTYVPNRTDFEFLPDYEPEHSALTFDSIHLDQEIRRTGFVELFRFRFGR